MTAENTEVGLAPVHCAFALLEYHND